MNKVGSSAARTVPLIVTYPIDYDTGLGYAVFDVCEEELVLGLRNIGREADADIRLSMLRILMKRLIAASHK